MRIPTGRHLLLRNESVLESPGVEPIIFQGQEVVSVLVMFALPRNTAAEARVSVLNLPLLQCAPFPTVQGKVKSNSFIYSTNKISTMS